MVYGYENHMECNVAEVEFYGFRRPFVKEFAIAIGPLSVLSCPVCDVGVLWPNGWMDQYETWHAGRPGPRPHCVRWGSSSPKGGTAPILAHVRCGQTAGWVEMPLGTEVGLCPGDIVLDGDPALPPPKVAQPPRIFGPFLLWPNGRLSQLLLSTCFKFLKCAKFYEF